MNTKDYQDTWAEAAFICGKRGGTFEAFLVATEHPKAAPVWIKLSEDSPIPEVAVIALNKKTGHTMTGFIEKSSRSATGFNCIDEVNGQIAFINCTHYIPVSELLFLNKE